MSALDGRIALVTGGSRGIGRAIAIELAEAGADVALNYRRDHAAASETATILRDLGARAEVYPADVSDPTECAHLAESVLADFGGCDVLVANAGVASRGQPVVHTEVAEMERCFRTHTLSAFALAKALLPTMRTQPRADIVFVSSQITDTFPANSAPYNVAKAALEALAATLAKEEVGHGVHVNVVAPGLVVTDMGRRLMKAVAGVEELTALDDQSPFGRVCRPEDVAAVVRFLVSDAAGYVTGQRLGVHGP